MVTIINETGIIGSLIHQATINVTGTIELTVFAMFVLFIVFGLMFKLPFEWIFIIMIPLVLVALIIAPNIFGLIFAIMMIFFAIFLVKILLERLVI